MTIDANGAGTARTVLSGQVPSVVAKLAPIGRLPATNELHLAIGLPLRNPAALDEFLRQLYDPASTNFHRLLTPEEFTARFGPTTQDYQAVIQFAESNGLTVVGKHPNRVVLDVAGSVSNIERAFQITLRTYPHPFEPRTFYAPDVAPSVDAGVPVLSVSGLDNFSLPRPKSHRSDSASATPKSGSGSSGSYAGNDFRAAYVPGVTLNGSGQSVALLEFDGYYANDITAYENSFGLPAATLMNVAVDGGVGNPGSGNSEVALDIEMVIAMAPGLSKVIVYEAPNPSPWPDLLNAIANDNAARQISCSWGGGSPDATSEQIFKQMAAQGQSFFNASGDSDAFTGSIPFPSDSTNITQVGGTTLTTTGPGGSWSSETTWNWGQQKGKYVGSSGGISTFYSLPSWQQGISMTANHGSTSMRNVPDVALTADNIYVKYNNGSAGIFGGTSAAAPLWAAFTALANQQAATSGQPSVGFINPAVYAIGKGTNYLADFHDITTGNNFSRSSPNNFPAVAGYDLCTGWGTPSGAALINALVPALILPSPPSITNPPVAQTIQCGSNASFSVAASGTAPLNYQWRTNGVAVAGGTNTTLSLTNVHLPGYPVSVVVTNLYGSATSSVPLTVQDTLPPVIALNGANPFYVELGSSFVDPGAIANDLCAGALPVMTNGTVNTAAVSTNLVTYSANDGNGNTNFATRTVIVRDTTPPAVLRSFTNLVLVAGTNATAPMPVVTGTNFILATDLSGAWTITQNPTNNFPLPLGTNAVLLTVADPSGNDAFSSNTIVVAMRTNAQPLVTSPVVQGGSVTLALGGGYGSTYILESRSNLMTGLWLAIATNTIGVSGVWQFTDTQVSNNPQNFYRLKLAQ